MKIPEVGTISRKYLIIGSTAALSTICLVGGGIWYFLNSDTPQLDGPQTRIKVQNSQLTYRLESYPSQIMGQNRTYAISLPPDYQENPQKRYPVIFLLHGGNGKPTDWFKKGMAISVIEKLYQNGKLPHSIIIAPDGNDRRGPSPFYDPEYIDGANGNVRSAIGQELVQIVKNRYRARSEPKFWAIGGLSSGGWGAFNIGLHHPDNFAILFSHSGYFEDKSGAENSPLVYIQKISPQARTQLRVYLDAGTEDGKYLDQSKEFATLLKQLQVYYVFHEFPGGHGIVGPNSLWNYWHKHLTDSLTFVGKQFEISQK
jgi:enterochelin esterase-like enzyme